MSRRRMDDGEELPMVLRSEGFSRNEVGSIRAKRCVLYQFKLVLVLPSFASFMSVRHTRLLTQAPWLSYKETMR